MQYRDAPERKRRTGGKLSLSRLGQRRMPWYTLLALVFVLGLVTFLYVREQDGGIARMYQVLDRAEDQVFDKEREVLRLSEQVRLATTDQFIANEARTKYGYLFPGEIRFVVLNPEVLGLPPLQDAPAQP